MSEKTRAQRRATMSLWPLAAAAGLVLLWAASSLPGLFKTINAPLDAAEAYGTMAGHSLFITVVVWTVLFVAFVARLAPQRGPAYFAILLAVAFGAQVMVFNLNPPIRLHSHQEDRAQEGVP